MSNCLCVGLFAKYISEEIHLTIVTSCLSYLERVTFYKITYREGYIPIFNKRFLSFITLIAS